MLLGSVKRSGGLCQKSAMDAQPITASLKLICPGTNPNGPTPAQQRKIFENFKASTSDHSAPQKIGRFSKQECFSLNHGNFQKRGSIPPNAGAVGKALIHRWLPKPKPRHRALAQLLASKKHGNCATSHERRAKKTFRIKPQPITKFSRTFNSFGVFILPPVPTATNA